MTAGNELRQARERAGLSAENISERTKIQLHRIEMLERDDYAQLPQGIYLDGMVRAYAHEVGIDPEPMVERVRAERGTLPGDWEVPFDEPIELYPNAAPDVRVLEPIDGDDNLDAFDAEEDLARKRSAAVVAQQAENRQARRRYGVAIPLLAMLAAAGWGAYLGERRSHENEATAEAPDQQNPNSAVVQSSERELPAEPEPRPVTDGRTSATPGEATQDTPGGSYTPSPQARATSGTVTRPSDPPAWTRLEPTVQNRPAAQTENRPAPQNPPANAPAQASAAAQTDRTESPNSSPDVTGSWRLATQIESTSYAAYSGLRLGYEMQLEQEGDRITGTGRKVTENGNGIGARAQTPVTVTGTIEGDRLTLNFVERGARRATQGKFILMIDDGGTLRGRFSSDAARSSGRAEAHRMAAR